MPVRCDRSNAPESTLPLYLQPRELARVQGALRSALRVVFASSLAAAGCSAAPRDPLMPPDGDGRAGNSAAEAGEPAPPAQGEAGRAGESSPPAAQGGSGGSAGESSPPAAQGGNGGTTAPPAAESGSGGSEPAPMPLQPVCDHNHVMPLAKLQPAEPVDYVAWRWIAGTMPDGSPVVMETSHEGSPCSTATDKAKCDAALVATIDGLKLDEFCSRRPCKHYFVTTRGDQVKRYASIAELQAFLGPIDAPQEAVLLAMYSHMTVRCDSNITQTADGYELDAMIQLEDCPVQHAKLRVRVSTQGELFELSRMELPKEMACVGRRPEGLVVQPSAPHPASVLGAHFAAIAELEAASVSAFEILAQELHALAAPPQLIAAARAAADDEVRHARVTGELARRFGGAPRTPRIEPRALRDLEALALDNAVEGCVRETFGAAIGCQQALAARDPEIAEVMREIAIDETRHAALAWELHAWLMPQLPSEARTRVTSARQRAVDQLASELDHTPDAALCELAGLPDAPQASLLYAVLQRELWHS